MFEKKYQSPLPLRLFALRMASFSGLAFLFIVLSLGIGVLGYHYIAGFSVIDSILNASMILTGMGPVGELPTTDAKLFASAYALFSGLVFVIFMGILLTPILHRILHKFHFDETRTTTKP
ncbi:MAG: hypothetical protein WBQ78_02420 [Gammaproteobacteria bacterium]